MLPGKDATKKNDIYSYLKQTFNGKAVTLKLTQLLTYSVTTKLSGIIMFVSLFNKSLKVRQHFTAKQKTKSKKKKDKNSSISKQIGTEWTELMNMKRNLKIKIVVKRKIYNHQLPNDVVKL